MKNEAKGSEHASVGETGSSEGGRRGDKHVKFRRLQEENRRLSSTQWSDAKNKTFSNFSFESFSRRFFVFDRISPLNIKTFFLDISIINSIF